MTNSMKERINIYREIEKIENTKIISYILGDNPLFGTQIAKDVINLFGEVLDSIGSTSKITMILYTVGGDTLAAWNIVNLITQYCDKFEVIIPFKAQSAGTLLSLRANRILMTKKSVLGPIDPSINTPLNPKYDANMPNMSVMPNQLYPVSVESIREYFNYAKNELGLKSDSLASVYNSVSEKIHPLVIGQSIRTMNQIKMLAGKLLTQSKQVKLLRKNKIIKFLCSDSGSHDYTINSKEAKDELGLPVVEINGDLESLVNKLYTNFNKELHLSETINVLSHITPNPNSHEPKFSITCGLIECTSGVNYSFENEGIVQKVILPNNQYQLYPNTINVGWKKNEV